MRVLRIDVTSRPLTTRLIEGWQLDQVFGRNALHGISGFAPGAQATGYYIHFESEIL
jgi:hypothetical protein